MWNIINNQTEERAKKLKIITPRVDYYDNRQNRIEYWFSCKSLLFFIFCNYLLLFCLKSTILRKRSYLKKLTTSQVLNNFQLFCQGGHLFSTYAKFSKKLTFFTFEKFCIRTKWMIRGKCQNLFKLMSKYFFHIKSNELILTKNSKF